MNISTLSVGGQRLPRITIGSGAPRILITAGMHGDEFSQQLVLARLLRKPPAMVSGTIDILPRLNVLGLQNNCEVNPEDGLNMNRVFPGNAASSHSTEKIASAVFDLATRSDAVIDLHNFTDPALSQIIFVADGTEKIQAASLTLAQHYGIPLIWRIRSHDPGMEGAERTLIYNAVTAGIPAIGVELPPLDVLTEQDITTGEVGLRNSIALITGNKNQISQRTTRIDRHNVFSPAEGILIPQQQLGSLVTKDTVLATIMSSDFSEQQLFAGKDGLLTRLRRPGPVEKNTLVANIGIQTQK